jgi:hypothetical protein
MPELESKKDNNGTHNHKHHQPATAPCPGAPRDSLVLSPICSVKSGSPALPLATATGPRRHAAGKGSPAEAPSGKHGGGAPETAPGSTVTLSSDSENNDSDTLKSGDDIIQYWSSNVEF